MNTHAGKRLLSMILTLALVITMMPAIPGTVDKAYAETALTMLYVHNSAGVITPLDEEALKTDVDNLESDGWKWNAVEQQLELNGFEGQYIEAQGPLNIVLTGENSIVMPASGSTDYGIFVGGILDIKGDGTGERDSLFIGQTAIEAVTSSFTAVGGVISDITITDCDMVVKFAGKDPSQDYNAGYRGGLRGHTHVSGDATLDIDIATGGAIGRSEGVYALYAETSGTVDIDLYDVDTSDKYTPGADSMCCATRMTVTGTGSVDLSVDGAGYAAADGIYIGEGAGTVTGKGLLAVGARSSSSDSFSNNSNYNMPAGRVFTSADGSQQYGIAYNYSTKKYTLVDQNGAAVTEWQNINKENNPLVFLDNPDLDEGSVQLGMESWDNKEYLHGLVFGGTQPYTYKAEGLPAGISISSKVDGDLRSAYIKGEATEVCEAGTAVITVTDATGATASIEVNYGAVTDPPKYITVDGYMMDVTTDGIGEGWAYTGATKTLALDNYSGGVVKSEDELNIVLDGNNTITMDAAGSDDYGIQMGGALTISGDRTDGDDTLYIGQSEITDAYQSFTGIGGFSSTVTITDCDLDIEFDGDTPAESSRSGIHTEANLKGDASLDVDISAASSAGSVGVYDLKSETSGKINIDLTAADSEVLPSTAICTAGLMAKGTGDINLNIASGGYAATSGLYIGEDAGTVTSTGYLSLGDRTMDYFSSAETYNMPADRRISSHDGAVQYGIALTFINGKGVYTLIDSNGSQVTEWKIEQVENNPLVFLDYAGLDCLDVNLGDSWRNEEYLHGLIFGGQAPYKFTVKGNPGGISLSTKNGTMPYLTGSFEEYSEAGTITVTVTDAAGATASIDIDYGETKIDKPLTGMVLDKNEIVLYRSDTATLTPVFMPEDATVQYVRWTTDAPLTAIVDQGVVTAMNVGKATIKATTAQGGFNDTCTIYVKENTPEPYVDGRYICGLIPGGEYTVDDRTVVADDSGCIEIVPEWVNKTVSIVKMNDEPKCISDSCSLLVESVLLSHAVITLSETEYTYDGMAHEPDVSVVLGGETLTKDTDYTVSYDNNIDAGQATATISASGEYEGTVTLGFTIAPVNAETCKATLSYAKKNYTGAYITSPVLTVKDASGNVLEKGTDYTVSGLANKKAVGRYKVTVTFTGNYDGTKTLYFTIVPKAPASASAALTAYYGQKVGYNDVKFSWDKAAGATGYNVYYKKATAASYTFLTSTTKTYIYKKNLADGIKYNFKVVPYYQTGGTKYTSLSSKTASVYTLKKLAAPTVSKNGTKVKVKWKNINGETGYQISRSTSKTGTNIVATYATTSGTYKTVKADKGKKYYYKVRAYKVVGKVKVFGPWSDTTQYTRK